MVTVYDTLMTYNVTAGVGPFNASYVQPYFDELRGLAPQYPYQVLPYSSFAMVNSLVADPTYSTVSTPVACAGDGCSSYLLSGGLVMTTPWVPMGYGDHPMVKVDDVPSIQLDFDRAAAAAASFADADCSVYGSPDTTIGVRLCLRTAGSSPGRLLAGLFVCQNGTAGGACGGGRRRVAAQHDDGHDYVQPAGGGAGLDVQLQHHGRVAALAGRVALPAVDLAAYGARDGLAAELHGHQHPGALVRGRELLGDGGGHGATPCTTWCCSAASRACSPSPCGCSTPTTTATRPCRRARSSPACRPTSTRPPPS